MQLVEVELLAQNEHATILVTCLSLQAPRPTGVEFSVEKTAVPVGNIGEWRLRSLKVTIAKCLACNVACAIKLVEFVVISVGNLNSQLLSRHGFERRYHAGHEVIHVVNHVAILVDDHGVLIKFEATPYLTHLTALQTDFVIELPAHHHDVGCFGKVVFALCRVGFVEAMTEAIRQVIAYVSFDF